MDIKGYPPTFTYSESKGVITKNFMVLADIQVRRILPWLYARQAPHCNNG